MNYKNKLILMLAVMMMAILMCVSCGERTESAANENNPASAQRETEENSASVLTETEENAVSQQREKEEKRITPASYSDIDLKEMKKLASGELLESLVKEQSKEESTGALLPTYIYYGSKDFTHLMLEEQEMAQRNADTIFSALAKHNIVTLDTKVNSFSVVVTEQGTVRVLLDLNQKFEKYLQTMAETSEEIIMASITDTFLENYDADELVLTVDGMCLKTTHNTYKEPLTRYGFQVEKVEKAIQE